MSYATTKLLEESRKLRKDIRIRRDVLKRELMQFENAVAAANKSLTAAMTRAKHRK